jgi:hypothetical protein
MGNGITRALAGELSSSRAKYKHCGEEHPIENRLTEPRRWV